MDMPGTMPPLTWGTALGGWHLALGTDLVVVVAALLYLHRAHRTLPRSGTAWPAGRTAAFLGGLVLLALTLQSSIDAYGGTLFWVHMIEHLMMIMVVPALVIIGQPIRLAATGTDHVAERTNAALRSRTVSVLTFPLTGLVCYAVVLVGTHLTGFMQAMLVHMWPLHDVEILLYLGSGYLFFLPVLGSEPLRRTLSYPLRVFLLLLGMSADTVVGVMLMMTTREPFPAYAAEHRTWGPSLMTDIHTGGGIMWVVGDGLMFAITVLVVARWMSDTERQNDTGKWLEAARRSSLGFDDEGDASIDDDDAALAAYNRMLAKLDERDRQS